MKTTKWKEAIILTLRGYKFWYKIDKNIIIYKILYAICGIVSPYTTVYISALLITGIAEGKELKKLFSYALAIVGINLIMSFLNRMCLRKINASQNFMWEKKEIFFNSVNMSMQYEHLENPETYLKRDRIFEAQNANGFGTWMLLWHIEQFIRGIFSVIISISLSISLFILKAPGTYSGIWTLINSPLSVIVVIAMIILNIYINILTVTRQSDFLYKEIEELQNDNRIYKYYNEMLENYNAAAEIRIFDEKSLIEKSWLNIYVHPKYMTNIIKYYRKTGRLRVLTTFFMNITLYLFIGAKAYMGAFGIGNFVLYISTIERFISAISDLFQTVSMLSSNIPYLRDEFSYLDMPNNMYQGTLKVEKRAFCEEGDNDYEIEFRDVSFRYPNTETYALRHINLKFKIGEKMAVVGENGSGKTTFIKLLCRLYDPTEGVILLNGIDIKKYDYDEYMSIFSVVFQDFKLFSFSLGQNVAANTNYDESRVIECLTKSGFSDRLAKMPKGIETCLYKNFDEEGVEISGGEAQKIALARALYKNAPFIILDEPTAALDPISEYEIYSNFNRIVGNKTAIYISHRLSSCRFCNDIAVFSNGSLIQRGSHDMLIQDENGKYHELWNAQAQYYTV